MIVFDEAHTPADIERRSFDIIDAETWGTHSFSGECWEIARRCVHACGDISIVTDLAINQGALENGLAALRDGCTIYTDTRMLAAGIVERRMRPLGVRVVPLMALPGIASVARRKGITRARSGIEMIAGEISGAILAIGNAPTALMALLEVLEGQARSGDVSGPALIVGMPVGFVNAAQSKDLLMQSRWPHFSIRGRKGGSAMAAACINALADIVLREKGVAAEW